MFLVPRRASSSSVMILAINPFQKALTIFEEVDQKFISQMRVVPFWFKSYVTMFICTILPSRGSIGSGIGSHLLKAGMWLFDFSSRHDIDIMDFTQNTTVINDNESEPTKGLINRGKDSHVHYTQPGDCRLVTVCSLQLTLYSLLFPPPTTTLHCDSWLVKIRFCPKSQAKAREFPATVPIWWTRRLESGSGVILFKWLLVKAQLILPS